MRVDSSSLIAGALVCGDRGLGVPGSAIPSVGTSGAGYAYNDLSLPADNAKEICGRITSWPSSGTLYAYEDTSFTFSGAPDGSYSFAYQLYVDGVAVGSPATVSLQVGNATVQIVVNADDAVFSGGAAMRVSAQLLASTENVVFSGAAATTVSARLFAVLDGVVFTGGVYQNGAPNEVSIFATTDTSIFYGGAVALGSPAFAYIAGALDDLLFSGSATSGTGLTDSQKIDLILASLNTMPSAESIAAAILAAAQITPIHADARSNNGAPIIGDGSEADPWRGVGVLP